MSTHERPGDDFDREIRAHLELETARLIADGVPPGQARARALRAFGNVTRARERYYERHRLLWLDHLRQDLRAAWRAIARYPIAAAVAVLSLGGGIGAATATLTIRDVVFNRYPPLYAQPEQLSRVQVGTPDRPIQPIGGYVPARLYLMWRDTLGLPAAAATLPRGLRDLRLDDRVEAVRLRIATPDLFDVLGVAADIGVMPAGADADAGHSLVLSHHLWTRLFDARADAVGRTVWIDNEPYRVAAVMPERFWFSDMQPTAWAIADPRTLPADEALEVIVRRGPDVSPARLDARLQTGLAAFLRDLPAGQRQMRLLVSSVQGTPLSRELGLALPYVLGASVLLTLLIACANVAVLMIAQWTARERETAIRAAIGAGRSRIVRGLLTESVLIAALGGALGVGVSFGLRAWVIARAAANLALFNLSIDPVIFVKLAALTLLTGIAAGVAPALYETRRLHAHPLRTLAGSDRVRQRWRHALVIGEIAVTAALFVEVAALIGGYLNIRHAQMGFAIAPLMAARAEHPSGVDIARTLEAIESLPGVAAAAAATAVPFTGVGQREHVAIDAAGTLSIAAERASVTSGFFSTLGVTIRAGRAFSAQDSRASHVTIVNESLAKRLFDGAPPVGRRIWIGGTAHDVIGVAADYAMTPAQMVGAHPKVFLPIPSGRQVRGAFFLVRAAGDPAGLVDPVRHRVRDVAPATVVSSAYTFDQTIDVMEQEMLVGTAPLFPLIAIGSLLTTAGIYGVLAFALARRSRELAVRMAIGATGRDVVRLLAGQTMWLAGCGVTLGVGLMFVLSRIGRAAGGGSGVFDFSAATFLVPVAAIFALAAAASVVPSRRARHIDPAVLLRDA